MAMKNLRYLAISTLIFIIGCIIYLNNRSNSDIQNMGNEESIAKIGFYAAIIGATGAIIDLVTKIIEIISKSRKKDE